MYCKNDVLQKIQSLLTYSVNKNPDHKDEYKAIVSKLESGVNSYFGADRSPLKGVLHELELSMYSDIQERGTKYEDGLDRGMRSDFPKGYTDLRDLFYSFAAVINCTPEKFFEAWKEEVPVSADPAVPAAPMITANSLVDEWVGTLSTAVQNEQKALEALNDWLNSSLSQGGMVSLWEDTKESDAPKTQDIATELFDKRGWKECIQVLDLPAYLPTYK